jgi:hypothetical protein
MEADSQKTKEERSEAVKQETSAPRTGNELMAERAARLERARNNRDQPLGQVNKKRPAAYDAKFFAAGGSVLSIAPQIYREYAEEFRELARNATSGHQVALYVKMANTWAAAAVQFESGLETGDVIAGHSPQEDDQKAGFPDDVDDKPAQQAKG